MGLQAILASVFKNRQNSSNGGYLASFALFVLLTSGGPDLPCFSAVTLFSVFFNPLVYNAAPS